MNSKLLASDRYFSRMSSPARARTQPRVGARHTPREFPVGSSSMGRTLNASYDSALQQEANQIAAGNTKVPQLLTSSSSDSAHDQHVHRTTPASVASLFPASSTGLLAVSSSDDGSLAAPTLRIQQDIIRRLQAENRSLYDELTDLRLKPPVGQHDLKQQYKFTLYLLSRKTPAHTSLSGSSANRSKPR